MSIGVTLRLAEFISSFKLDDVGADILRKVKLHILDTLAVALSASGSVPVSRVLDAIPPDISSGSSKVWGRGIRLNLFHAVRINGIMSHTLELDDVHREAKLHPGAVVIPAALGLGEYLGVSGRGFLGAVIVGYESMIRIGKGVGAASHRIRGWHATGTCGTFGSAAASSFLLGLDAVHTASALGLAGTQSSGLWAFTSDGSMSKKFHPGRAAESGVLSAFLSKEDFTGPTKVIEADDGGFFKAASDEYSYDVVVSDLGREFYLLDTEIKPFACCRSMHPAVEAALRLRDSINVEDIASVLVRTFSVAKMQCGFTHHPANSVEAQFSLPYAVAVALIDGEAMVEQFSDERVHDKGVQELAGRVEVVSDEQFDAGYPRKWQSELVVYLSDGSKRSFKVTHAKGSVENPLSDEEMEKRFLHLVGNVLSRKEAEALKGAVLGLEHMSDIRELLKFL
ncbi:MAG: MmgE/PrpD family protein [Synergistetes bacterium]|nr:MmgE/PrpD family protein [Synergistota bacterium]